MLPKTTPLHSVQSKQAKRSDTYATEVSVFSSQIFGAIAIEKYKMIHLMYTD